MEEVLDSSGVSLRPQSGRPPHLHCWDSVFDLDSRGEELCSSTDGAACQRDHHSRSSHSG